VPTGTATVKVIRDRMEITEFDHCIPHLKGSDAGHNVITMAPTSPAPIGIDSPRCPVDGHLDGLNSFQPKDP